MACAIVNSYNPELRTPRSPGVPVCLFFFFFLSFHYAEGSFFRSVLDLVSMKISKDISRDKREERASEDG